MLFDEAKYLDINGLAFLSEDNRLVRSTAEECPFDHYIETQDIKLSVPGGPQEDKTYLENPLLVKNVRRGNTLINFYNDEEDPDKCTMAVIGRKGLPKFFNLEPEFLLKEERKLDSELQKGQKNHKNLILAGAKKAILEGNSVEIVKTLKANGENA